MSDSVVLRPRRKKYHRRGPWACDECRLRKRKCDGTQPCKSCISTSISCAYDSRHPNQTPTQKIRSLEDELRLARTTLEQLRSQNVSTGNVDLESVIQALQRGLFRVPCPSSPGKTPSNGRSVDNMMGGSGRLINCPQNREAFFGASSGFSFVCRTLELFLKVPGTVTSTTNIHPALLDLFDGPLPENLRLQTHLNSLQDLPARTATLQLLDSLFARCSLVAQFLPRAYIRQMVDRIYQPLPLHGEPYRERTLVLIHSLLALGYLYHVPLHRTQGCQASVNEALQHFTTARRGIDIVQCHDLTSLQTLLCVAIFLTSTSRIAAAHPYIAVAWSSCMRLGLHSQSLESLPLSYAQLHLRRQTLITILKLDVYSSLVLGLPPFVELRCLHRLLALLESNLASDKVNSERAEDEDNIRLELSLKHLHLLKITASGLDAVFPQVKASTEESIGGSVLRVNIQSLEEVGSQLQQWAGSFSTVLLRTTDFPGYETFKHEVEITYYFCQILLYQPFLHYLKKMADGQALSWNQSQQALACIKISSVTITRSEVMMKRGWICSASWMPVYSIFLAVVCLVFLIAAHNGTLKPSEAWKKAQSGIRLLAAARCRDDGATTCLVILKKLIAELSHTVDFDIEQIESSTARLCQHSLAHEDSVDKAGSVRSPKEPWTHLIGSAESFFALRDPSVAMHPPSSYQATGNSDGVDNATFTCDADEILAQAQEISFGHGMNHTINLDDYIFG